MTRRSRRRNRSRSRRSDSWRRSSSRCSYDSGRRSRSFSRSRRSSRDRRSPSRSRRRTSDRRAISILNRDRRKFSETRRSPASHPKQRKPAPQQPTYAKSQRPYIPHRPKPPRYRHNTWTNSNKYESEEFKSQRLQRMELLNQQQNEENIAKERRKQQLAEFTAKLTSFVSQLSLLPKDSADRASLMEQIQDVRKSMTDLRNMKYTPSNTLDNRETKLLFRELPESAKGPGKLAEWIGSNSSILLPKQIAMLALSAEGAVVEYNSRQTAETVMNSCKLHGIDVCWASLGLDQPKPEKVTDDDVDYNLL